jgi:circadian clock protein KaiC
MKMVHKKVIRVKTNISGFDKLVEGGLPVGSNNLVIGTPGSGKTIFSIQYIVNGALSGEFGIYFTFEEKKESLFLQANQFGWDLEKMEKDGLLKIISIGTDDIGENTIGDIVEIITSLKTKRVVIDSVTTLSYLFGDIFTGRKMDPTRFMYSFITGFNQIKDLTTLFISQKSSESSKVSEYICDGILSFDSESLGGSYSRNLSVKKMRSTKNDDDLHPFEICDGQGIKIHNFM